MQIQSGILHVGLHFFLFSLICNMTIFRKEKQTRPFDPTTGVEGLCYDSIFAFMVLRVEFPLI